MAPPLQAQVLIHSDQGAHYTSVKFVQLVKDSQLRQSMSRRANCWDNAPQESFFGHMKDEFDLSACTCFAQIHEVIRTWVNYYNNERYQWNLTRLAPAEYYRYLMTGEYPLSVLRLKPTDNFFTPFYRRRITLLVLDLGYTSVLSFFSALFLRLML